MAAGSVVGNRYPANFDVLHIDPVWPLVVVADGMGDGPGSAIAGRTAVDVFVAGATAAPTPRALRAAVAEVQLRVRAAGAALGELTGCTLTAFVGAVDEPDAWIVQLGDSRAYRLRDGLLELLTTDHTMAWLGAVYGWWPADSPEAHAARYRLTRYAGHPDSPEPDVLSVALRAGDVFLLCTDGLAEQVGYERLTEVLRGTPDPGEAATTLLEDSLRAGGDDNATAAVIRVGRE
ncbi:PP2C family protein-serine/threonine phosphatase [Amorphoplanes digitatis]|uniref:Serine/threonine protein phosphatase PrpC n=1 Tax=Actinoplanes digitatis TaxID=1868 RepID=A0A7W7MQA3_9ACTN|nr:PP2C family serine/threonine-protein phosphatase [Actinoplanes digitatis]MBB4762199.1 serine/threonine protein phosphatase PrpC [Actinoplanes digitatis]GID97767.1 protein phosphatase [Actinoplanes digitatis]